MCGTALYYKENLEENLAVPTFCGLIQLGCGWLRLLHLVDGEEAPLEPCAGVALHAWLKQPCGHP
jgi:hypothetical protein